MRLKEGFFTQNYKGSQLLMASGSAAANFCGIARSNETAAFIVDCFKKETSEEAVVEALLKEYDVTREVAARDVRKIIEKLNGIGALE